MKLYYISNSFIPSTAANSISTMKMSEKFAINGYEVILICKKNYNIKDKNVFAKYNLKKKFKIKFVKLSRINLIDFFLYGFINFIFLLNSKNSQIYCKDIFTFFLFYLFKKKKLILELHHSFENSKSRYFLKYINFEKIKLVVISENLRQYFLNKYKIQKKNILTAHDGADINYNYILKNKVNKKKISVGYIGSLNIGKGIRLILKIAQTMPSINFHIFGGSKEEINDLKKNNINNLFFHGHIYHNKIENFMHLFEVALLPNQDNIYVKKSKTNISKWTSPLKMFEYMAYKKIIIASNHYVLKEILSNNYTCLFCNPNDHNDWVNKINYVLENYNDCLKISNNAFSILKNNYTWDIRSKNIIKFLNNE